MRPAVLLLPLLLAACIPPPRDPSAPQRPRATGAVLTDDPAAFDRCLADLARLGAQVTPLPDRVFPNGCSATGAVKAVAIGIPVTNLGALKCGLARGLTEWVTQVVQSAAADRLGGRVVRIESYGSFACRPINNQAGNRLSEHGRANGVDIAAFVLANGRRITVREGWNGPDEGTRAFLRQVHAGACRRFSVVLGPDYNVLHADHLHFDMGSGRYCR